MPQKKHATPDPPTEASIVPSELDQAIHDLRNSMNTLLMSAAVLGARIEEVPESLRPFVQRISASGQRGSQDLARLHMLIDQHKG